MLKYIKNFKQISKNDVGIAGGKGASLGEMTRAGIIVPSGFVITAQAFERFLAETDLTQEVQAQLDKVNYEDTASVEFASEKIRSVINNAIMSDNIKTEILKNFKQLGADPVAVRSSATAEDSKTASWAGELETYLNTTEENLLENIKKCWSSLFTPRAIFYRKEKELLDSKVSVAVVIQKMIQSEIAGVCFTVHPVTKDKNQMIIEAVYGLGELLVSGEITPDSYVVNKPKIKDKKSKIEDFMILDINVVEQKEYLVGDKKKGNIRKKVCQHNQNRQKLSGREIIKLAQICKCIEDHYGFSCDIEWTYKNNKFYVVQSRPITTL